MEIRPVAAALIHAYRRTNGQTDWHYESYKRFATKWRRPKN